MDSGGLDQFRAINEQLARSNHRVRNFVARLKEQSEHLQSAAQRGDWPEVRRQSDFLAASAEVYGFAELADSAREVCNRVDSGAAHAELERPLGNLLDLCLVAKTDG